MRFSSERCLPTTPRYQELGPDYYRPRNPARQARDKIREIERLNPGKKVILADVGPAAPVLQYLRGQGQGGAGSLGDRLGSADLLGGQTWLDAVHHALVKLLAVGESC